MLRNGYAECLKGYRHLSSISKCFRTPQFKRNYSDHNRNGLEHAISEAIRPQKQPSLKMPLAALSATVLALAFYTGYKVVLHKEPAFIPFALCGYCRKPWKSEFDSASIKEILRSQLASRLAVDTEALQILGVPITIPGADDDKISILVKSTSPGIHGLLIDKDWNVSVETRYISKPTDNLDKLMAGASTAASKNDTNTEDGAKSEVSEQKVIVEGQFKALCGSNLDHNKHTVSTATIYFVATRDFYARDSTVAFKLAATTIGYQDDQGETCYLRII